MLRNCKIFIRNLFLHVHMSKYVQQRMFEYIQTFVLFAASVQGFEQMPMVVFLNFAARTSALHDMLPLCVKMSNKTSNIQGCSWQHVSRTAVLTVKRFCLVFRGFNLRLFEMQQHTEKVYWVSEMKTCGLCLRQC